MNHVECMWVMCVPAFSCILRHFTSKSVQVITGTIKGITTYISGVRLRHLRTCMKQGLYLDDDGSETRPNLSEWSAVFHSPARPVPDSRPQL